jgi:hypothetical protein
MFDAMLAQSGVQFVTALDWRKAPEGLHEAFRTICSDVITRDQVLFIGRGARRLDFGTAVLTLRERLGGRQGGLWSFGVAESFELIQRAFSDTGLDSPILSVAVALPAIQIALCLDDDLDMVFVRNSAEFRDFRLRLETKLLPSPDGG